MHGGHSINKVNIAQGISNKKHCLLLPLFFRKINKNKLYYVLEECQHDLLY